MSGKSRALLARVMATAFCLFLLAIQMPVATWSKTETVLECPQVQEEQIHNKAYLVSRVVVKARPEYVWQVLTDYNGAPNVFPRLKVCKVIAERGTIKTIQHEIHPSGLLKSFQYVIEVKETGRRYMEWHRLSGDFKEVDGFWKLDPIDGGHSTMVTYATYVNGGIFMPQILIKRQFRIDIPEVMVALKAHSERFTQIAARKAGDIARP